jgi:hypothetical protein
MSWGLDEEEMEEAQEDEETEDVDVQDDTDEATSGGSDDNWGDEIQDMDEPDDAPEPPENDEDTDTTSVEDVEVDNLSEEPETDTSDETEESETTEASSEMTGSSVETIDVSGVAPNAMNTKQAAEEPYLWRILGWAEPGKGKTHFGFTMPEPVCIIDTEGKAHNLASKFEDRVTYIWQPEDYDEARNNLDEAIRVLDQYLEEGHRGTIVVDSMSEMWEWSKQKYVSKVYDGKSLEEVNLSSNMGQSGKSDWKVIKRYHNKRFREVMLDTPFHIYWTAMQTDDYEQIIEGAEGNPKKPVGERDNPYKVDQILRFVENSKGVPVGQLQKNGLSKYRYAGLRYPTFPKHKEACDSIRFAEDEGMDPMLNDVLGHGAHVVEGNPERWNNDD